MSDFDKITFTGYMLDEREKSYLIELENGEEQFFPKSQTIDNNDGTYTIPKWLFDKKKMEE